MIIVKESTVEDALVVNSTINEFDKYEKEHFESKYKNKDHLILVAYIENKPVGYTISYDKYQDGSFYCWMAGVDTNYRRKGVLKFLMDYLFNWAKVKGYKKIRLKTRNNRREMLSYLIKNGFDFLAVKKMKLIKNYRIFAVKKL